jgi:hypothetical protein
MPALLELNTMAAKKPGRPMGNRSDTTVKMDADVVAKAKIAAAYKGKSLAEYLTELVRPLVVRDIEQEHARMKGGK